MKLKMLVVAAGFLTLPVIAGAQAKDTTMKTMAAGSALPADSTNGARPVPPSDGTTCPWGCPTSKGTAGLTGAQFLALQQEMRDKGCGTIRITGVLDSPTRHGISVCEATPPCARTARVRPPIAGGAGPLARTHRT